MSAPDEDNTSGNNSQTDIGKEGNSNPTKHNIKNDSSTITIKRSTFIKLAVVGIAALMVSAFLAGYNLRSGIIENTTQAQLTSAIQALQNQPPPQIIQQQTPPIQQGPSAPIPSAAPPPPPPQNISSISLDGAPVKGKPDAPITLVEFLDFQCPFCSRFSSETLPQIVKEYVDTGKVKFVSKHFPMDGLHLNAQSAAIAAECANEQGKFWEYHDVLFANQTQWENQSGNQTAQTFKQYATKLGLDMNKFNTCFDSNKYQEKVSKELQEGSTYGVSGTPAFYIGNEEIGYTQIVGAQPFVSFKAIIDQKLQQQPSSRA
jgi:protein-disulfide isomerase